MPHTADSPAQRVLQSIRPEERQSETVAALCAALEDANATREKAIAELERLRAGHSKEADGRASTAQPSSHFSSCSSLSSPEAELCLPGKSTPLKKQIGK